MKRILIAAVIALTAVSLTAGAANAAKSKYSRPEDSVEKALDKPVSDTPESPAEKPAKESPKFPEKGWHKGPYLALHGGFMQATNDKNLVTNRSFNGSIIPAVGLTFGWDIADWIGPMLQFTYGFATDQVGDGNVDSPIEDGREHAANISLFVRATLPYFTRASWQPSGVKFIPYLKLGGTGHAIYVHANGDANKTGVYGGGIGFGGGCEFFIWKGLFFAIDFTENVIFQQSMYKTVRGVPNTKILEGGTKLQANVLGLLGWHF